VPEDLEDSSSVCTQVLGKIGPQKQASIFFEKGSTGLDPGKRPSCFSLPNGGSLTTLPDRCSRQF
jgi:hypothetical protein